MLTDAAVEAGLNKAEVEQILNSDQYERQVIGDEVEVQQLGIQGAPFFVINNKYAISGAQPYEVFVQALEKVKAEEK